jgi:hypothetical protein
MYSNTELVEKGLLPAVKAGFLPTWGCDVDGRILAWWPSYGDPKLVPCGSPVRGSEDVFRDDRVRLRCDRCQTENVYDTEALIHLATEAGVTGKKYVRLPAFLAAFLS